MRLRSLLFVPGDRPDLQDKALGAGADALILDLEDSVAPSRKSAARAAVAAFLRRVPRPATLFVRVNGARSGLLEVDLEALAGAPPDGWVLPKAEGSASILETVRLLRARAVTAPRILPIASETPAAVFRLGEYAAVAGHLAGITWGAEDLPAAIGAAAAREADGSYTAPYEMVRSLTLFAAHAAGVAAIDTVYPAFRDAEGLSRYAARGARDGFTGMLAIHPAQVAAINAAFTPAPAAIERARRIVEEFARHPGAGVLGIDGAMVDAPHLEFAQRLLARADAMGAATDPGAAGSGPGTGLDK